MPFPLIQGHRGALYDMPENTVESFRRAAVLGASAIELDIFLDKAGVPIVFHGGGDDGTNPGDMRELCGVSGNVQETTAEALGSVPFTPEAMACPADRVAGTRIPTLRAVLLAACKEAGMRATLELKGAGTEGPVVALVGELDLWDSCTFSSFNHSRAAAAGRLIPPGETRSVALLFSPGPPADFVTVAKNAGATEVDIRFDFTTKAVVDEAHAAGLKVMAWFRGPNTMAQVTASEESLMPALVDTGADVICTNRPGLLACLRATRAGRAGIELEITGMMCMKNCGKTVLATLNGVGGVTKASVAFTSRDEPAVAMVEGTAAPAALIDALEVIGFDARVRAPVQDSDGQGGTGEAEKVGNGGCGSGGETNNGGDTNANSHPVVADDVAMKLACTVAIVGIAGVAFALYKKYRRGAAL